MSPSGDWVDVFVFFVIFISEEDAVFSRTIVLKDVESEVEVETLLKKMFPRIKEFRYIDLYSDGFLLDV